MDNWKHITDISMLNTILEASTEYPQIIFKDSVTCGISAYAKSRLIDGNHLMADKAEFHYLDLLKYRPISNHIAELFNVYHQSPQILVVKNKEVVYTSTHHSIHAQEIAKYL
jgi:bacillithiol system protein YtxJ